MKWAMHYQVPFTSRGAFCGMQKAERLTTDAREVTCEFCKAKLRKAAEARGD